MNYLYAIRYIPLKYESFKTGTYTSQNGSLTKVYALWSLRSSSECATRRSLFFPLPLFFFRATKIVGFFLSFSLSLSWLSSLRPPARIHPSLSLQKSNNLKTGQEGGNHRPVEAKQKGGHRGRWSSQWEWVPCMGSSNSSFFQPIAGGELLSRIEPEWERKKEGRKESLVWLVG